jgi:hypothetical protein
MAEPFFPFSTLPSEIQVRVASFVPPPDRYSCLRVCRKWNHLFIPFLWRHIKSNAWCLDWEDLFLQNVASGSLRTHGHYIKSVKFNCRNDFLDKFLELAPSTFPRLTSAKLSGPIKSDDIIADFIRRCTRGLRRLEIVYSPNKVEDYNVRHVDFGAKSADALFGHVATLKVFRVEAPKFTSKEIQRFLCSAPKLKEFYILPKLRNSKVMECSLDANDVVGADWVCTDLRVFGCQVTRIPRVELPSKYIDSVYPVLKKGTPQESTDLQHRVYKQLGRLVRLEELQLGIPLDTKCKVYDRWDRLFHRQYDCLAMTLESGVDLMRDCKRIRLVCLYSMAAYFGEEDKQWMEEHWPELVEICYSKPGESEYDNFIYN